MSACRLEATITSIAAGLSTMRVVAASTRMRSVFTSGKVLRHFVEDLVPQHHAVALRVRLGDQRQVLARPLARQLEGEAVHALDAAAREGRDLHRDFVRQAGVHAAAGAGILALGVLAHDHPVDLVRVAHRRGDAGQQRATAARWRTGRSPGRSAAAGPRARRGRARRARRPRRRRWRRTSSAPRGRRRGCRRRSPGSASSSSRSALNSSSKTLLGAQAAAAPRCRRE